MRNKFYVPEYAQHPEWVRLRGTFEQLLRDTVSADEALASLDDKALVQVVSALEHAAKVLREKRETIQSQQRKIGRQYEKIYASPVLRDRILKNRPIDDLKDLPDRVYTLLRNADITTIYDLCSRSRLELFRILHKSRQLLDDVDRCLEDMGLELSIFGSGGR